MTSDLTAKEKAQAGLWLIRQAILQLIRKDGPMRPHEVADELGLRWETREGVKSAAIAFQVMRAMADTDLLTRGPEDRSPYSLGPAATH
jgi:hypothetical protein